MLTLNQLKNDIKDVLDHDIRGTRPSSNTSSYPNRIADWDAMDAKLTFTANGIARAVETYVKSMVITIQPSQIIVVGSPSTQTNTAPIRLTSPLNIG